MQYGFKENVLREMYCLKKKKRLGSGTWVFYITECISSNTKGEKEDQTNV